MSQSLTSILATTFYGLAVVLEESSIKLRRLAEESESSSRWVGDDRSEQSVTSGTGLDKLFGACPDLPEPNAQECSDEEAERIVEASMAPIISPECAARVMSEYEKRIGEAPGFLAVRDACLTAASSDNGTNVTELEKLGHDKAMVKKALRELIMEHKLTTTGVKRGVRYFAVKGMEAAE